MCPIPKQDHRARVFIVLNVDDCQTHNLASLIWVFKIKNLVISFVQLLVWVNDAVKSVRFTVDQCCFDRDWLPLQDGVLVLFWIQFLTILYDFGDR